MTTESGNNDDDQLFALEVAGESAVRTLFALVHNRFRELEQAEKLSQQQLANRMGLTRSQISRWFASPSNMTLRSAAKLLMAMGRKLELADSTPLAVAASISEQNIAPQMGNDAESNVHRLAPRRTREPQVFAMAADSGAANSAVRGGGGTKRPNRIGQIVSASGEAVLLRLGRKVLIELPPGVHAVELKLGAQSYNLLSDGDGLCHVDGLSVADAGIFFEDHRRDSAAFPTEWN